MSTLHKSEVGTGKKLLGATFTHVYIVYLDIFGSKKVISEKGNFLKIYNFLKKIENFLRDFLLFWPIFCIIQIYCPLFGKMQNDLKILNAYRSFHFYIFFTEISDISFLPLSGRRAQPSGSEAELRARGSG